jgi:hypothetical protein
LAFGLTCLAAMTAAFFGKVLFCGAQFAFRDAATFYYPLYARVHHEWAAGRLPLWEPGKNGGTPMLGDPMAAVLYPGQVLFALVPYPWGIRLYTVAHEVLAFGTMVVLMHSWGVGATGATLAALCYAFGGPVVSNYFNIIYLVGAAWLPLGFHAADQWLRLRRRGALVELALVLAMQVLGGDPEAAYLTMLCALGYAAGLPRSQSGMLSPGRAGLWGLGILIAAVGWAWVGPQLAPRIHGTGGLLGQSILALVWALGIVVFLGSRSRDDRAQRTGMLVGLAVSGLVALALSGMQTLPVLDQIATSVRWIRAGPTNRYDFSTVPYRAVEWVWPNVLGSFTAGNHFWMSLLPPTGVPSIWPLTLYVGALPLVLALGAMGFRAGPPWRAWLSAIAILSFWASLGAFAGPARWSSEASSFGGDGSLYGLLSTLVPGLSLFRFPCKLLVFTALALAALTGMSWEQVASGTGVGRRRVVGITVGLFALTALVLTASAGLRDRLVATMAAAGKSSHDIIGPLDPLGAFGELLGGLGHGAIALASSLAVVIWSIRRSGRAGLAAMALVAVDLCVANARLVIVIPQADFEREPEVVRAIRAAERDEPEPGPFRIHRPPAAWVPGAWFEAASTQRMREIIDWEIDTLQSDFGLLHGFRYVLTDDNQTGRVDYRTLFRPTMRAVDPSTAVELGIQPGRTVLYYPRQWFDLWGVRYFIVAAYPGDWTGPDRSYAAFRAGTDLIYPDLAVMAGDEHRRERQEWVKSKDVQVRRNRAAFPRAWAVHDARLIRPLAGAQTTSRAWELLVARLGFPDDPSASDPTRAATDLRTMAYVETDDPSVLVAYLPRSAADPSERVTVQYDGPSRVVLEARLRQPGLIVLADVFDPGWRLTIDGRPAPVWRANLLMRAAAVSAGAHTLVYSYQPASVRFGAWASLTGLVALIGLALWARGRQPVGPISLELDEDSRPIRAPNAAEYAARSARLEHSDQKVRLACRGGCIFSSLRAR